MATQTPQTIAHNDELTGVIDRFLFQNNDNGYAVFLLQIDKSTTVTVQGTVPNIHPGEQLHVSGSWVMHPKFGKQFHAQKCTTALPSTVVGLQKYLASGMIKGIGPAYAERLVKHFGTKVLEIIDANPERLREVPGIGQNRADTIINAWKDQKSISSIMVFLQEKNISPAYALKIYKTYGQQAIAVVQENPYRLADDIWGIGFKIADQIAQNMGLPRDSVKRIRSGILFAIAAEVNNGHLYVELQDLKTKTATLLELESADTEKLIKTAFHELYDADKIKLVTYENKHFVTLAQHYFSEKGCAQTIATLQEYRSIQTIDVDAAYAALRTQQSSHDIVLNDEQQQGIMTCLQNKVTIITGGPGTGKTTLIKKLLHVLELNKLSYKLAAPTGRAAKRITEGTGRPATTIHRLLEFDFMTRAFVHNEKNALQLHFLIIDESSMIDIFLAHAILKAMPLHAHLVFIGDVDQLPSVGAGNFLNDLIASKKVACVRLQQIFRQAQDSLIIVNAHRINQGEFPTSFLPDAKRDFVFIKEEDPTTIGTHLEKLFKEKLPAYGISPKDATVLVPMNRGVVGTIGINHHLQQMFNPSTTIDSTAYRGTVFKVGDRVMQIRNNYDKLVFNGDIGTISSVDKEDQVLIVTYQDRPVEYEYGELDELTLAYAITIHKSQGSEYPAAIIPIFMQHFTLLQRNLIYTAITRAKRLCIFIGQPKAIAMAINNNKGVQRTTFLQQYITTDLKCR